MNGNNMRPIPMPENIDTNTQSIRELQEFLRRIAYSNEQIPLVAIDGIYKELPLHQPKDQPSAVSIREFLAYR